MFFAGTSGRLLLRSDDRITLFEPQSRRVLAELQSPRVKYVLWNKDCTYVALVSKHGRLPYANPPFAMVNWVRGHRYYDRIP